MIKLATRSQCCGCSACADACPHRAISMKADAMGFKYPEVDPALCTDCGICEQLCAFKPCDAQPEPSCEAIRFPQLIDSSQSGGLAFAIMRKAIRTGYVVYGAATDDDFCVRHRRVESEEGLEPLRLSKYLQSDTEGIPARVLKDLQEGRKVLFTGTPCQCAGVASLCRAHRQNLLLSDIICHGVPGLNVWKDYLRHQEKKRGRKLTGALFRDPALGWHGSKEALFFGDEKLNNDEYNHLYFSRIMMRPACYACPFASLDRPSDITMGDCWGIEKVLPGFADDNRGCSLLITHTDAGREFTLSFHDACERKSLPVSDILQPNLTQATSPHKDTELFENTYIRKGYAATMRRFGRYSLRNRINRFICKHKRHQ